MSKPHKNNPDDFREFYLDQLQRYAKEWVKDYSVIQIERITLYRYDTYPYDLIVSRADRKKWDLERMVREDSQPILYAIVFEISNCLKTFDKYPEEYLHYTPNVEYVVPEDQEELQNIACFGFMKACEQAYRHETYNRPHPFLNSDFPVRVYKEPVKDFRKEWVFYYQRPGDNLEPNILTDEAYWILYDSEISVEKEADIQNETTEQDPEYFPPDIIELMNKAHPGIELIYRYIKQGVGFKDDSERAIDDRMEEALFCLENEDVFRALEEDGLITKEDLKNRDIYNTTFEQRKRSFIGKLLQTILVRRGFKRYSYSKVFDEYQKQKRN